jgi:dipeptidase
VSTAFVNEYASISLFFITRSVWRVFSRLNPDNALSAYPKDDYEYPFSIKPAHPITARDLMAINRDHYEGTQFDMTKV